MDKGWTIIRLGGQTFPAPVIFAGEKHPSLLGVGVLEEALLAVDPREGRLEPLELTRQLPKLDNAVLRVPALTAKAGGASEVGDLISKPPDTREIGLASAETNPGPVPGHRDGPGALLRQDTGPVGTGSDLNNDADRSSVAGGNHGSQVHIAGETHSRANGNACQRPNT